VRFSRHANLLWLAVETDAGLTGWGEAFFAPEAVEACIHARIAPEFLGADASRIGAINTRLVRGPVGYASSGVEMRAAAALDIALWDIAGQAAGLPLHRLLGGAARDDIRVYNTCAGPEYVTAPRESGVDAWFGLKGAPHALDDLRAFEEAPADLARSLLAEGVTAMKIWPLDRSAFANGGIGVTDAQIEAGLAPFRAIRDAVGRDMEMMLEMHALWDLASARRIIRAAEDLGLLWVEDPVRMDDTAALSVLARESRTPILACETLGPAAAFLPLIAGRIPGVVSFDPGWCGGITQGRAICDMAAAAQLPVAVHDCTGPIGYVAGTHLSIWAPTAMIQETVRAYLRGWYADLVTALPPIAAGRMRPLDGPGLGCAPRPDVLASGAVIRRRSGATLPAAGAHTR
jgi:L-alanine-DL-glutamate epimerase-like enolase superfamily enzyme